MSDFTTALIALTTGLWWIWAPGLAITALFTIGLARAAGRPMPQPVDADREQHVADAVALSETPIYAATAAHIAKHAAENIASEWAELNGESS